MVEVQSAQPQSALTVFSKPARPCPLFTLQWYLDNPLACLRRCVCMWTLIGLAHISVRAWWEVSFEAIDVNSMGMVTHSRTCTQKKVFYDHFSWGFLTHMKNVNLCNDQCWAGWLVGQVIIGHGKNFNVAIFLDTINVINVKPCMMVLVIDLTENVMLLSI